VLGAPIAAAAAAAALLRRSDEGLPVRLDAHRAEVLARHVVLRGHAGVREVSAPACLAQGALGEQLGHGDLQPGHLLLMVLPQPGQRPAVVLLQSPAWVRLRRTSVFR